VLKDAGRSGADSPRHYRVRNALVVVQVALAMVLLVVSGLMFRTVLSMRSVQPGFVRPADVQTFRIDLPPTLVGNPQQVILTHQQIAQRLAQVAGVTGVGLSSSITMDGAVAMGPLFVEDRPRSGVPPPRRTKAIGPGYFETMGNPVVAGRSLTWEDVTQLKPVAMVSENLAREYWDTPSKAIGKRISGMPSGPWFEIVGVVGSERDDGLNKPAPAIVYRPMATKAFVRRNMAYAIRSERVGQPGFMRELQQAVWAVNPNVPLATVLTLTEIQGGSMAQTSFAMVMLALAAGVALGLALVGIYGVASYVAVQRTHEIGIRMALGAQAGDVRALFLRHGAALTLGGIALGTVGAMLATPVMAALLYGIGPMDPSTYAGVAIGLAAVTVLATYVPAHRASRVPPTVALRSRT
jgi:predicted permease